jgi:GTPase SAR1 family protein
MSASTVEKAALLPSPELVGSLVDLPRQSATTTTVAVAAGTSALVASSKEAALLQIVCPHPTVEREAKVKVVVLGGRNVGKSAVVRCIRNMPFVADAPATVGYDIYSLLYSRSDPANRQVRVELWDVSHREIDCDDARWARILAHAASVILVCDARSYRSFAAVDAWRARVARARPLASLKLHLVVNKSDLAPPAAAVGQRGGGGSSSSSGGGSSSSTHHPRYAVTPEVLEKFTRLTGFSGFATTSAKTNGAGVHATFDALIHSVLTAVQSFDACRRQWRDPALPYIFATWPQNQRANDPSPTDAASAGAVGSAFWSGINGGLVTGDESSSSSGGGGGGGGAAESLFAMGHRNVCTPAARLRRVVEDVSALALPTSAFATQATTAVLTMRRPDFQRRRRHHHYRQHREEAGAAANAAAGRCSGHGGASGSTATAAAAADDDNSGLATHVVILSTALRQCIDEVYDVIGAALRGAAARHQPDAPAPTPSSRDHDDTGSSSGSAGAGEGAGSQSIGIAAGDGVLILKQLEEQRQDELRRLHASLNKLPLPAAAAFVARAPEALAKLQVQRRVLLRKIADWQFAFQSLGWAPIMAEEEAPASPNSADAAATITPTAERQVNY